MKSPIHVGYMTMARIEVRRIFRIWTQTLLPPVVTTSLYFVIFGVFIGPQVAAIDGVPYMQFIVPGLVMMTVITAAYANVVSTFFGAKMMRYLEELLVSPMPSWTVILGYVTGGVVRALIVALLVLIVSLFFTKELAVHNLAVIFGAAFLTALLFALAGLINGVFAKSFDAVNIVPTFVLTPLTYLGGVFYSIHQLPEVFKYLSLANPILYMVNAFRYGFLGVSDVPVGVSFMMMGAMVLVLLAWALWLFKKGGGLKH